MTQLELSKSLSKRVRDEISNKLNIKELDLNSAIDTTINILENLKRDLPYSAEKRLWNEFNQSVSELHKIKGEIKAYYYAKQLSDIMKGGTKMRKFELINNTEPAQVMAEIGSTCVEIEDGAFVSFLNSLDIIKNDFISVLFTDESGFEYDQIIHISQLKEIE